MQQVELEKSFEDHIKRHEQLIYQVCRMYGSTGPDRQDLYQEIIIQLWKAYPRFKGESAFSTWLYRIAINTAITGLRKKKDFIVSFEPSELPAGISHDPIHQEDDQVQQLYNAIDLLNPIEKAIVLLYLDNTTYEEMENVLGINQGNLRVKVNRIKDKLRQLTKKD